MMIILLNVICSVCHGLRFFKAIQFENLNIYRLRHIGMNNLKLDFLTVLNTIYRFEIISDKHIAFMMIIKYMHMT